MIKKRLLVTGLGFLGSHVYDEASQLGLEVTGTSNSKASNTIPLEISDEHQVEDVINKTRPDYVINCAARADIDYLETNPEVASKVNTIGARNIAKTCSKNGIRLLHISTDSVFDGKTGDYSEEDKPNPINVYSRSKYEGELEVEKHSDNYLIIRTNFYGINKRGTYFFNWILNSLKNNSAITGYTDIIFSPLDVQTLSKMILELVDSKYNGIVHLSSGQPISKFDFIVQVAKKLDIFTDNIKQGKQSENPNFVRRPKNTSLKNDLAKRLVKTPILDLSTWMNNNRIDIDTYLK